MSELVWLLDRGAALVAYPTLYLAVLTGIFYNTEPFGVLHEAAQRVHIELSVFAMVVTLLHALLGILDTWFVVTGESPLPAYSRSYFVGGVVVWRFVPQSIRLGGLVGGLLSTLVGYAVCCAMLLPLGVVSSIIVDPSVATAADSTMTLGLLLGCIVLYTSWATVPVGVLTGYLYERSLE